MPDLPPSLPLFPLQPDTFPAYVVRRKPTHATIQQTGKQGRETGYSQHAFSLWEFELTYDVLRDQTQNIIPGDDGQIKGTVELQKIFELYLASGGQYGEFLFLDSTDNSRLEQQLGVGDGSQLIFPFVRSIVGADGLTVSEQVGQVNIVPGLTVSLDGIPIAPGVGTWSITEDLLFLVFISPPGVGVVVTSTFHYYYKCRWISDEQEVEEFVHNMWSAQSVRFRSVNPYVDRLPPLVIDPIVPPNPPLPVLSNCLHDFLWWNTSPNVTDIIFPRIGGVGCPTFPGSQALDKFGNFYLDLIDRLKIYDPDGTPIASMSQVDLADAIDSWAGFNAVLRVGAGAPSPDQGFSAKPIMQGEYVLAFLGSTPSDLVAQFQFWWAVLDPSSVGTPSVVGACFYRGLLGPPYAYNLTILDAANSQTTSDPLMFLGSFAAGGTTVAAVVLPSIDDMSIPPVVSVPIAMFYPLGNANLSTSLNVGGPDSNRCRQSGFVLPNSSGETILYMYFNRAYMDFCRDNSFAIADKEVKNVLQPAYQFGCIIKINLGEVDFATLSSTPIDGSPVFNGEASPSYSVDNVNWKLAGGTPMIPFSDEYTYISRGNNIGGKDVYEMEPAGIIKRPSGKFWVIFYMVGLDDFKMNGVDKIYESFRIFEYDPDTEIATQLVKDSCILHTVNEAPHPSTTAQSDYYQSMSLFDEDNGSVTLTVHGTVYKARFYNFTPPP